MPVTGTALAARAVIAALPGASPEAPAQRPPRTLDNGRLKLVLTLTAEAGEPPPFVLREVAFDEAAPPPLVIWSRN